MVIQRWQSILLFLAAILMVCGLFVPMATVPDSTSSDSATLLMLTSFPVLMTIDILVSIVILVSIFMYGNLKKQMKVNRLSMLLIVIEAIAAGVTLQVNYPGFSIAWMGVAILLIFSLILCFMAGRMMRRDYNLLRSADRLR